MDRRLLTAAGVVLLAGALVFAVGGFFPTDSTASDDQLPGSETTTEAGTPGTASATEDHSTGGDGSDGSTKTTAPTTQAEPTGPYRFDITDIQECGSTCREVTVELTNTGDETRMNVVAETTMYADGEQIWQGSSTVGTLEPGETVTRTETVDVGYSGGYAIQQNDGYVTIETVIDSAQGTETYEERRQVA